MTDVLTYNPPSDNATATLILLHGLGATANDLYPLAESIGGGQMRAVFPQAPTRAITLNGGWQMPAWYNIVGTNLEGRQDEEGIKQSALQIEEYIAAEIKRAPHTKIFLGGFSQGAAMSIYAGLRTHHALTGIIALSGYMLGNDLPEAATTQNRQTPIFQAHGVFDPVVLPIWATQCRDTLQENNWQVSYHDYPMAHAIAPQTVEDLNTWLAKTLSSVS
ncbi:MAG: alpha/beta hydrolase [Gammaproteobacteria bacterium WSBS_2016_MAG_OTU1]